MFTKKLWFHLITLWKRKTNIGHKYNFKYFLLYIKWWFVLNLNKIKKNWIKEKEKIYFNFRFARNTASFVSSSAREGVLINIENALNDPRYKKSNDFFGSITKSLICVPLMGNKGVLGKYLFLLKWILYYYIFLSDYVEFMQR